MKYYSPKYKCIMFLCWSSENNTFYDFVTLNLLLIYLTIIFTLRNWYIYSYDTFSMLSSNSFLMFVLLYDWNKMIFVKLH